MAIFLYHKYALPALKSEILKGVDRLIYDALMEKGMAATLYGLVFSVETNREGVFQEIQAKETPVEYLFYGLSVSPENVDDRIERVPLVVDSKCRASLKQLYAKPYQEWTGNEAEWAAFAYYTRLAWDSSSSNEINSSVDLDACLTENYQKYYRTHQALLKPK